jgi:hypothetical protein
LPQAVQLSVRTKKNKNRNTKTGKKTENLEKFENFVPFNGSQLSCVHTFLSSQEMGMCEQPLEVQLSAVQTLLSLHVWGLHGSVVQPGMGVKMQPLPFEKQSG